MGNLSSGSARELAARKGTSSPAIMAARALPEPGMRLGQYELIRELGRGGMGTVFLARDTRLGRRVAIKFLHSDHPELTARFILEARATARCSHENIIIIHEVGEQKCNPFMVLEYLEGSPLSEVLGRDRALPVRRAIEIMLAVARALERAHAHNIVHRDLKPENIFITHSGTVKVLDFGIAKLLHEPGQDMPSLAELAARMSREHATDSGATSAELTRRGALVGTVPYMSPEQWGMDTVDHRTDLWAAGILLYRMVVGRHPLAGCTGMQFGFAATRPEPMPGARNACPAMSDELAAVIDLCLMKRKAERTSSAGELIMMLEPLLPGSPARLRADENPYPGLSAFQEKDASRFFGRAREITAAVTRLGDRPLLGVVGASGVGKSSFVRAGVLPALKLSGESWASLVIRPGRQPVAVLAELIAPMGEHAGTTIARDLSELDAVHQRLYDEPGYLGAVLRSRARKTGQNVVLFIDQFEELYTLVASERERKAFTACLASVADDATSPLRVILSIRSDFLDRVPEDEHFMAELTRGLFFLMPPGRDGLREALVQPAELAGHGFESPAMVEHMLDHLQETPGALPLLSFAASKLWDTRDRRRRTLTAQGYRDLGGIAGALASHADAVLSELSPADQAQARSVLVRLVTPERTRGINSINELDALSRQPGAMRRLIDHLVRARLLVVQTGAGGASVELVHESLIHSWPLLRRWLDDNQDDAAFLEQLRTAARQWLARKYASGLLWRGEAADEARRWRQRYRGALTELEESYLQAVFSLGARTARVRRHALAGVIMFLSLLVAAAAIALIVIRDAKTRATEQARQVEEQLARVQAEQARRKQAEVVATQASKEVDVTRDELARRNVELEQALARAEDARAASEQAEQRADQARRRAEANEAAALEASRRLEVMLAREKARADMLAGQGTMFITGIPVPPAVPGDGRDGDGAP